MATVFWQLMDDFFLLLIELEEAAAAYTGSSGE
jgi:hypothetical protein